MKFIDFKGKKGTNKASLMDSVIDGGDVVIKTANKECEGVGAQLSKTTARELALEILKRTDDPGMVSVVVEVEDIGEAKLIDGGVFVDGYGQYTIELDKLESALAYRENNLKYLARNYLRALKVRNAVEDRMEIDAQRKIVLKELTGGNYTTVTWDQLSELTHTVIDKLIEERKNKS